MDGEKPGYREAMGRLQARMQNSGMAPKRAEEQARKTTIRRDRAARNESDKRKR